MGCWNCEMEKGAGISCESLIRFSPSTHGSSKGAFLSIRDCNTLNLLR